MAETPRTAAFVLNIELKNGGPPRANARTWDTLAEFIFNFAKK